MHVLVTSTWMFLCTALAASECCPPSGRSLLPLLFPLTLNELLSQMAVHVHGCSY